MHVMMFLDVAYKAIDGKASSSYVTMFKGNVMAHNSKKVTSSKEAKSIAVLHAIKKVIENGCVMFDVLRDAKKVVQARIGDFDWEINNQPNNH